MLLFNSQISDSFEEETKPPEPVNLGNKELRRQIAQKCSYSRDNEARELAKLLNSPNFKVKPIKYLKKN